MQIRREKIITMFCELYVQILCFWFIEFRVVVSLKIRVSTSSIEYKLSPAQIYFSTLTSELFTRSIQFNLKKGRHYGILNFL